MKGTLHPFKNPISLIPRAPHQKWQSSLFSTPITLPRTNHFLIWPGQMGLIHSYILHHIMLHVYRRRWFWLFLLHSCTSTHQPTGISPHPRNIDQPSSRTQSEDCYKGCSLQKNASLERALISMRWIKLLGRKFCFHSKLSNNSTDQQATSCSFYTIQTKRVNK